MEIVVDGYQPCDACGQIEYTEETACSQPDVWREDDSPYQHCQCWYDCEPCHKCGDHPVVLYGPPFPKGTDMMLELSTLAFYETAQASGVIGSET